MAQVLQTSFVIQRVSRGLAELCHDCFVFSWFDLDLLAVLCPV